ncbi:MAG: peptidylprolyl isomerase [Porticoccaceae bacterium]|nr:peptidylprolyl isomerase [Porticoccaceae bacterium]MDG1473419.1 peptidylprolyl isomerase [Porticoccaceae bacterium]
MGRIISIFKDHSRIYASIAGLILVFTGSNSAINWPNYPSDTLVLVNKRPITQTAVQHARQQLISQTRQNTTAIQDGLIIERLIDDELLLQRAENLDLLNSDPGIRKLLARTAIQEIIKDSISEAVSESQLRAFYLEHQDTFQEPKLVKLQVAKFSEMSLATKVIQDTKNTNSLNSSVLLNNVEMMTIPQSALPAHMLRRYLGPSLATKALSMENNQISDPIVFQKDIYLIQILSIQPATTIPFVQAKPAVIREFRRKNRDIALLNALKALRKQSSIDINTTLVYQLAI